MATHNGLSIGLLAGSFNPAHAGHMHVAQCGISRLGLDQIWWIVSPQNPLKPTQPAYEQRVKTVEQLNLPFSMRISHIERDFQTHYTIDMLKRARQKWPQNRFVFLMGADNFLQLPKWQDWQGILKTVPIAIISRPGKNARDNIGPRLGRVARQFSHARLAEADAKLLAFSNAPAWTYLTPPLNPLSSTAIRAQNKKS